VDAIVRRTFESQRPVLERIGVDAYSMTRFDAAAFNLLTILLDSGYDLSKANVLEVGCGAGMKAFPVAAHVNTYVGVDLDEGAIRLAKNFSSQLGLKNTAFVFANAADVFLKPGDYGFVSEFNVLFIHAVMEHLTPEERAVIYPVIRKCWEAGGLIIIGETPNRLLPFDYHSTELHFHQMLPDEIAIAYSDRSPREVARNVAATGRESFGQAREALYRLGRGLSYHDFELYFSPDAANPDVLSDSFHPALLNFQPISHSELQLGQYFRANRLPIHRMWSRSNVDVHMWKEGRKQKHRGVEVADFSASGDHSIARATEFWTLDTCLVRGKEARIVVNSSGGPWTGTLGLDVGESSGAFVVECGGKEVSAFTIEELKASQPPRWHSQVYLPVLADGPVTIRPADNASAFAYKVCLVDA
jgi:SAM-dependent methyltransferase